MILEVVAVPHDELWRRVCWIVKAALVRPPGKGVGMGSCGEPACVVCKQ